MKHLIGFHPIGQPRNKTLMLGEPSESQRDAMKLAHSLNIQTPTTHWFVETVTDEKYEELLRKATEDAEE